MDDSPRDSPNGMDDQDELNEGDRRRRTVLLVIAVLTILALAAAAFSAAGLLPGSKESATWYIGFPDADADPARPESPAAAGLPCPADQQVQTDLDVPGPGQPTPKRAVSSFAEGEMTVTERTPDTAVIQVVGSEGVVVRTLFAAKHDDGWWPDGYTECAS